MEFTNSYEDELRAKEYSRLEFHNTYYLAFRDLPEIFTKYVKGKNAVDFGCGTGRSTRFLQKYGFSTTGIDISKEMIKIAKENDKNGKYLLVEDGNYDELKQYSYDLVLSAFTFDNIPMENKIEIFSKLKSILNKDGILINLVCSPEIYFNEWASFSTKNFPENKKLKTGSIVKIITTDFNDSRPCYDILCFDKDYKKIFKKTKLNLIDTYRPLAKLDEPYKWINETKIAPWTIYVLKRK